MKRQVGNGSVTPDVPILDAKYVDKLLPRRKPDAHKGDCGRVHMLVGSLPYSGAARLCIRAALRVGAGLVSAHVPQSIWAVVASDTCEAMVEPLPDDFVRIADKLKNADAVLVGPGLGRSPEAEELVEFTLKTAVCPVVLDADGINAFAKHIHPLTGCPVLTPHDGEFARLGGDAQNPDKIGETLRLARELQCVLVRKGPGSLVVHPDGRVRRNTTGNPGMAVGGMGDVLAGMIAGFLAQGLDAFDAACVSVWLHGYAADRCAARLGERALLPSDVINELAMGGFPCG